MSDKAQRDIGGALLDLETGDGVLCSSARRKELKITRKMRAAWAGLSGLRQERFQGSWYVPDLFGTLMGNFKTCMRCL